jgi:hypothetical protein
MHIGQWYNQIVLSVMLRLSVCQAEIAEIA